jgi:translocation and assembly module TamB
MRKTLILFCGIIITVLISFTFLIYTHSGMQLLFKIAPQEFSAAIQSGNLASGFSLTNIRYRSDDLSLQATELSVDWELLSLLKGRLVINDINIAGLIIESTGAAGRDQQTDISLILPFDLAVERMNIQGLTVLDAGSETVINRIYLESHTDSQTISIGKLNIVSNDFTIDINGSISLNEIAVLDLNILWMYQYDDSLVIEGGSKITGNLEQVAIRTSVQTPVNARLDTIIHNPFNDLDWQTTLSTDDISLGEFTENSLQQNIELFISANGTMTDARLQGSINLFATDETAAVDYIVETQPVTFTIELIEFLSEKPEVVASLDWSDVLVTSPTYNFFMALGNGQISMHYAEDQFHFESISDFNYDDLLEGNWKLNGVGDSYSISFETINIHIQQGLIQGQASVSHATDLVMVDASLDWKNINIPVTEVDLLEFSAGKLYISGEIDNYILTINSDVQYGSSPILQLGLESSGNSEQLNIHPITLTLADSNLSGVGTLNWAESPVLDITITGQNLDPGIYWSDWPGSIDIQADINTVTQTNDDYILYIDKLSATGILRDLPVQLELSTIFTADSIQIKDARLVSSSSTIEINGVLGEKSQFDWATYIPDLAMLHPRMSGRIGGSGIFTGNMEQPEMAGAIEASHIKSPWLELEKLYATFDINSSGSNNVELLLDIENIIYDEHQLDKIELSASGTDSSHDYLLQINADFVDLNLSGQGSYQDLKWTGNTSSFRVINADYGKWETTQPFITQLRKEVMALSDVCITQESASICFDAASEDSGAWHSDLTAKGLPIALINRYMPENITATGMLDLDIAIEKIPGVPIVAEGELSTTTGEIIFRVDSNNLQTVNVFRFDGQFNLAEGILESNLIINTSINQDQPLTANLRMSGIDDSSPELDNMDIDGSIRWMLNDLSFISTLTPRVLDVDGELEIDLDITGKASNPDIAGKFIVANAGFILPEIGIEVTDIQINGFSNPQSGYALSGSAVSGGGNIELMANIYDQPGIITASITGDKVELINLPEIRTLATPDINIELSERRTRTRGVIEISDTIIDLDEITATATLSDDVVFTERGENPQQRSGNTTDTRIQINLADNIQIRGQGITGKLSGNLDIFTTDRGELLGNGEIRIIDGRFSAYGQSLVIEEGRLIYSNNQLDNPEIRITATRFISNGDITAGINVTGFLSNPTVTLFSTPALSDDEILAYIVFGRPITALTSGEGTDLVGAATALGLQNSGFITRRLSSQFRLDDLQFTSDSTGENASLLIGKYLTPRLYISYMMGLFDNFSTAKIRYDLSNSWSLEATSGADVSVDIFYKINK